jgi:hypothetical protein
MTIMNKESVTKEVLDLILHKDLIPIVLSYNAGIQGNLIGSWDIDFDYYEDFNVTCFFSIDDSIYVCGTRDCENCIVTHSKINGEYENGSIIKDHIDSIFYSDNKIFFTGFYPVIKIFSFPELECLRVCDEMDGKYRLRECNGICVDETRIYATHLSGGIHIFSKESGEYLQILYPTMTDFGKPFIDNDKLYLCSYKNCVYVINKYNGEIIWKYIDEKLYNPKFCVTFENELYVLCSHYSDNYNQDEDTLISTQFIIVFDTETKKMLRRFNLTAFSTDGHHTCDMMIIDNLLYVLDKDKQINVFA